MQDLDLAGKTVLIRADLNVPINDGEVINDNRIQAVLPTLKLAMSTAKKIILMSHLGRPAEGRTISEQPEYTLLPVAERLSVLLSCDVPLINNYLIMPESILQNHSQILLLENVRINEGEKSNDDTLAKKYAELCDLFVMDAFGTAHRAQASTHGVARYTPMSCAGPLLAAELDALEKSLSNPERPLMAIVGGAKVSTKLQVLESLSRKVDQLIMGGGIANTFLSASGVNIGKSLCERELVGTAKKIMDSTNVPLPSDVVIAKDCHADSAPVVKAVSEIEDDDIILDIGPETAGNFSDLIESMRTVIWNGPMGVFEFPQFSRGTESIALAVARNEGFSIAGGGETIAAIDRFAVGNDISYISTGGGAFLEFVQGGQLPAVQILKEKSNNF